MLNGRPQASRGEHDPHDFAGPRIEGFDHVVCVVVLQILVIIDVVEAPGVERPQHRYA
jgi:hypothetical protein